jgi:site-specific DNA-methyltransferase (adenine-specific)
MKARKTTKLKELVKPYQLHLLDCVANLKRVVGVGQANLIFADSPYNQGEAGYHNYDDNKSADDYLNWTYSWLTQANTVLHKHGSMWVVMPPQWVSEVDVFCRNHLGLHRRNHVIWFFTFGQAAQKSFTTSHAHLLYYTKTKSVFTYNADDMRVPSARQLVYNDKRAVKGGKQPDDVWAMLKTDLEQALRADGDVWLHSRVCGSFKERQAHSPNQIPLPITDRIIRACSKPNDLCVDPFLGSGGTGVSAVTLGRRFIGFDISKQCVEHSTKRIDAALADLEDQRLNRGKHVQLPLFK